MVRRRAASPRPSAPVRSASPPSSYQRAPAAAPAPGFQQRTAGPGMAPPGVPSQGPGLMGQMAATAGGVAIGSAVGHAVGNMFSGGHAPAAEQQAVAPQYQQQAQQVQNAQTPCEIEWRQFLECSQHQADMNMCQSYNDLFKQCKARYNM